MSENRGMPPWFFLAATIVAVVMTGLYTRMALDQGFSFWMFVRVGFWVVFALVAFRAFRRARRVRRNAF